MCRKLILIYKNKAIGSVGPNLSEMALSPLAKLLKDNTINKLTICETLVRLGVYGE